jgi:hypothetical protein
MRERGYSNEKDRETERQRESERSDGQREIEI